MRVQTKCVLIELFLNRFTSIKQNEKAKKSPGGHYRVFFWSGNDDELKETS